MQQTAKNKISWQHEKYHTTIEMEPLAFVKKYLENPETMIQVHQQG